MSDTIRVNVDDNGIVERLSLFGPGARAALRKGMGKVGIEGRRTMRGLEPVRTGALKKATRNKAYRVGSGGLGYGQVIEVTGPGRVAGVHAPALYGIFENYGTEKNEAHHFLELTEGYLEAAAPLIIDQALDELISALDLG